MPTEMRRISFSTFRSHLSREMKFVYGEMGHLWLHQHGHPRGVVIPVAHERVLHRAIGIDPKEALHRAMVDCDRMTAAINDRRRYMSEPVGTFDTHYPPMGMDDESYRRWRERQPLRPLRTVERPEEW